MTTQFIFRIQDYTPETLPFERMLQYYQNLANMLGEGESMRLIDIRESSHASVIRIDHSAVEKTQKRLDDLRSEQAPQTALAARTNIAQMLAEDHTSATFEDETGNNVIQFPVFSKDIPKPLRIRDSASFVGELYHIAGSDSDAKVRINTSDYGVVFCKTTREIARSMREYLFEDVRVSGRGIWVKDSPEDDWSIHAFSITDFQPVVNESLVDAVKRIRGLGMKWPEDPLLEIRKSTEDKIHV